MFELMKPPGRNRRSRLVDTLSISEDVRNKVKLQSSSSLRGSQASLFHSKSPSIHSHSSLRINTESAVQRLESVAANLANAVEMVTNYENDAAAAANSVSKLIGLLDKNGSTENHYNACVLMHKLSERQAARFGLASCPKLLESLVHLLQTTHDVKTQAEASIALRQICYAKPATAAIRDFLSVPILVQLLSHPTETIMITALSILHKLMLHLPGEVRPDVRSCGGPIHLANLLSAECISETAWLVVCADAIRMTAYEDRETKLVLLDSGLPERIVQLFEQTQKEKLLFALARLIKVLSVCTECKRGLVDAGAVQSLTKLLSASHNSLILEALWGLRNLSDQAFHLTDTKDLLRLLIPCLSSSMEHIAICSAGCLCNLSCQNPQNKCTLVDYDAVPALCNCLRNFFSREEVAEPVCAALRNLTIRNPRSLIAVRQIQRSGILPDVVDILNADESPSLLPLIKAILGLLHNLALDKDCRRELQRLGATSRLIHIYRRASGAFEEAARQRNSLVSNASELSYIEGVRLDDLLELDLVALQSMAKHNPARAELVQTPGLLALVVQCLYNASDFLQRAALGLFSEVAVTNEGAVAIEREGAVARITELVQSSNTTTAPGENLSSGSLQEAAHCLFAALSASVLHRIAHSKPVEYRRRLSEELRQSLFDGGVVQTIEEAVANDDQSMSEFGSSVRSSPLKQEPMRKTGAVHLQLPGVPQDAISNHHKFGDGAPATAIGNYHRKLDVDRGYLNPVFIEGREASQII